MIFIRLTLFCIMFFSLFVQGYDSTNGPINCLGNEVKLYDGLIISNDALVKKVSLDESVLFLLELDLDWREKTIGNIQKANGDIEILSREIESNIELIFSKQAKCLINHFKAGDNIWAFNEKNDGVIKKGIALYRNRKLVTVVFTELVFKN